MLQFILGLSSSSLITAGVIMVLLLRVHSSKKNLPPGPRRLPLFGAIFAFPSRRPWTKFHEWKETYGDLVYVEVLGKKMLILNTLEHANELLEKRASNYSDRPVFTMVGELMGLDNSMPMLPYNATFKHHRRLCRTALSPEAVKKYYTLQEEASVLYLISLLDHPNDFNSHLRLTAGKIIMAITYGLSVKSPEDMYITEAEKTMTMISKATLPGAFAVDLIPLLKHLPSWIPMNRIPRMASFGSALIYSMVDRPFQYVKNILEQGSAPSSFAADCLLMLEQDFPDLSSAEKDHIVRWVAGAMYGAGGESTYTTILNFILAMARFPEVQKKLKLELEDVVGPCRLPSVQDRAKLPYVSAAIKEALRWRPALPLSIARVSREHDCYNGFHIPAGTIVIPNVWSMSVDTTSSIPTEEFAPDRFLTEKLEQSTTDPYMYAFGFGRRVCPGKYLAETNLFCLIAGLVHCFDISAGSDNLEAVSYTHGLVSYPEPFDIRFRPKPHAELLLKAQASFIE